MKGDLHDDVVDELELRRWLRFASVLLAHLDGGPNARVLALRRARHWLRLVLTGVEQRLARAEAVPETIDDPLTPTTSTLTIESEQ